MLNSGLVWRFQRTELPIAAHDDLAVARLASAEVSRESDDIPVGEFLRRRVVVFLPVECRAIFPRSKSSERRHMILESTGLEHPS